MSIDRRIAHSSVALPHIQRAQARNSRAFHRALNQLHDLRRNPQSKNNQTDLIPNMDTNRNQKSKNNQSDLVPYPDSTSPRERLPTSRQRALLLIRAQAPPTQPKRYFFLPNPNPSRNGYQLTNVFAPTVCEHHRISSPAWNPRANPSPTSLGPNII
jgi:hypothetical protein